VDDTQPDRFASPEITQPSVELDSKDRSATCDSNVNPKNAQSNIIIRTCISPALTESAVDDDVVYDVGVDYGSLITPPSDQV